MSSFLLRVDGDRRADWVAAELRRRVDATMVALLSNATSSRPCRCFQIGILIEENHHND